MADYKDQVSDKAIAKESAQFAALMDRTIYATGMTRMRSILLPIIEAKQKDAIGFKTWCDELHEQYYDAGIKEEFWKLADSTLEPLDYSDKELYELYLKQKA